MDLLSWVLLGLTLAYGLKNLCNSLRIRFNNMLEQRVVHRLRQEVFEALQRLSLNYYENRSTGEIMSRVVNDTEHVQRIFIDGFEGMLTATLTVGWYYDHLICAELEACPISLTPHSYFDRWGVCFSPAAFIGIIMRFDNMPLN